MDRHLLNVGFLSVSKLNLEDILGETVSAWRIVCDSIDALGGVSNVDVSSQKLLISCSAARHKYTSLI